MEFSSSRISLLAKVLSSAGLNLSVIDDMQACTFKLGKFKSRITEQRALPPLT